MAEASGLKQNAIVRIWRAFGLKPHLQENFKLSTDPFFVEKVRDIVGLYLNPPERTRAVVTCVDEKSQVQALDRSQPVLPMRPGQAERRTYKIPKVAAWFQQRPRYLLHFTPTSGSWLNQVQ